MNSSSSELTRPEPELQFSFLQPEPNPTLPEKVNPTHPCLPPKSLFFFKIIQTSSYPPFAGYIWIFTLKKTFFACGGLPWMFESFSCFFVVEKDNLRFFVHIIFRFLFTFYYQVCWNIIVDSFFFLTTNEKIKKPN